MAKEYDYSIITNGSNSVKLVDEENALNGPTFCPRLYLQRYDFVMNELRNNACKSLVDFGCAECTFISRCTSKSLELESIVGIDIDGNLLIKNAEKVKPKWFDFMQSNSHEKPLKIDLFQGSVNEYDSRLTNVDAVTMIELIEHLYDDVLESFPYVVFKRIQPSLVIITTPNSDFNALFPNFSGFRHYDHKFEWSQAEFQKWARKVANDFNYTVEFHGVGFPPDLKTLDVYGYCSQIAVFNRILSVKSVDKNSTTWQTFPYKLILTVDWPVKEVITWNEELLGELFYYIRFLTNYEEDVKPVLINDLLKFKKISLLVDNSVEKLKEFIMKQKSLNLSNDTVSIISDHDNDVNCSDFNDENITNDNNEIESGDKNEIKSDNSEEDWSFPEEKCDKTYENAENDSTDNYAKQIQFSIYDNSKSNLCRYQPKIENNQDLINLLNNRFVFKYKQYHHIAQFNSESGQFDDNDS